MRSKWQCARAWGICPQCGDWMDLASYCRNCIGKPPKKEKSIPTQSILSKLISYIYKLGNKNGKL